MTERPEMSYGYLISQLDYYVERTRKKMEGYSMLTHQFKRLEPRIKELEDFIKVSEVILKNLENLDSVNTIRQLLVRAKQLQLDAD